MDENTKAGREAGMGPTQETGEGARGSQAAARMQMKKTGGQVSVGGVTHQSGGKGQREAYLSPSSEGAQTLSYKQVMFSRSLSEVEP